MGGAGAWHLGMHYPDRWCSVGPGAGFVDFYKYQNRTEQLPRHQHLSLGIYDSIEYALNAFNVPVCTYGGELDKQLVAGASMTDAAKTQGVEIKLIVGPGMGHKFDPKSRQEFLAFHQRSSETGRQKSPRPSIKFTTRTLKYNRCDWLTILELDKSYHESTVIGERTSTEILLTTQNIRALEISHASGRTIRVDGQEVATPGDSLRVRKVGEQWSQFDEPSAASLRKKSDLQGPIDDAFMESFICVQGTGKPWNSTHQAWADWTLKRFENEFDKWLRGKIRIVDDGELSEHQIATSNLVLFGDPGSNSILARIIDQLPVRWNEEGVSIGPRSFTCDQHGLAMIYPNPLNPRRYVVINSGHTFHEKDFKASNAWLFPRLGDIAVQKFASHGDDFKEETVWADIFNEQWELAR